MNEDDFDRLLMLGPFERSSHFVNLDPFIVLPASDRFEWTTLAHYQISDEIIAFIRFSTVIKTLEI